MPAIVVRRATHADVAEIVALVESAYRGDASRAGWTTEADLIGGQRTDAGEVAAWIEKPDARILLGERAGRLVASLVLSAEPDGAYLGMFAVSPGLQGRGVGRTMLSQAERVAREAYAARFVRMTVIAQRTELIAWYERRGYARTGAREPFPYGDARFGEPRRDDLYFEVLEKPLQ